MTSKNIQSLVELLCELIFYDTVSKFFSISKTAIIATSIINRHTSMKFLWQLQTIALTEGSESDCIDVYSLMLLT